MRIDSTWIYSRPSRGLHAHASCSKSVHSAYVVSKDSVRVLHWADIVHGKLWLSGSLQEGSIPPVVSYMMAIAHAKSGCVSLVNLLKI